jgi:hypothetical protein
MDDEWQPVSWKTKINTIKKKVLQVFVQLSHPKVLETIFCLRLMEKVRER